MSCSTICLRLCRNCWQNYVDYYRCLKIKGEKYSLCDYFKQTFTAMCPTEWVSYLCYSWSWATSCLAKMSSEKSCTKIIVKCHIMKCIRLWLQVPLIIRCLSINKYICPQNCAFSDIFGPDLMHHVLALCMGIAICHRWKFGQVWGSPAHLPEVAGKLQCQMAPLRTFDYHMEKSYLIILRCNPWAVGWSPVGTF